MTSERSQLPWSFKVVDDPIVNAFALPGGFIFITRGILASLNSEAELAGVLGHEIGTAFGGQSCQQWSDIEPRMDAIVEIFRHQDYRFATERAVAGTSDHMVRIGVDMSFAGASEVRDVGFTVVLGSGDRWFLQIIELEKITSS